MKAVIRSCKLVSKLSKKGSRYYALILDLGHTFKFLWLDFQSFAILLGISFAEANDLIQSIGDFSVDIRDLLVDVDNK